MPRPNYISLIIDGQKADLDPAGQVPTVSYATEDEEDFEVKKSADSFNIELPGTLINDQIHNTRHNASVVDNSISSAFDGFRPCTYIANGMEILIGKYLTQSVVKQNGRPVKYRGKIYGLNGDWVIDLKEKTLFDFVNPRKHPFTVQTIIGSWSYDGRSEAKDYVYAPVRYLNPFGDVPEPTEEDPEPRADDRNVTLNDLKPAISPYWILYRGFKSAGYRIVSNFMDTDFYRRGVMPWTWGGFDYVDDTRWEPLKFLASGKEVRLEGDHNDTFIDNEMVADGSIEGTYDNNGLFSYTDAGSVLPYMSIFRYPTTPAELNLGKIHISLSITVNYDYKIVQDNSDANLGVFWYKNGALIYTDMIFGMNGSGAINPAVGSGSHESFYEDDINPGDYIGVRVRIRTFQSTFGFARVTAGVESFTLNYVKLTDGADVAMINYPKFKKYNWLDLLRGEIDLFDLQINTDPIRKEVYIEPTHAYQINGQPGTGFYNRQQLDWTMKQDLSKETELELYSDHEREFTFKFKDDTNDGGLKKVQDRNQITIGQAKFVLPDRFKTDKKQKENRFYSPLMHYTHEEFKSITGLSPQLIALIPENISNTSGSESENTYEPKRAWYKGNISGVGGWKFDGIERTTLPFMFAVNYKPGGENDPVLSYSDQLVGGIVAKGLLKKFFLQRMAILRHGRRYNPAYFMLNNNDVANFLHRESIVVDDIEYILTSIKDFNPVEPESTACVMWMFSPVTVKDGENTYPSLQSIQTGISTSSLDIKYWAQLLLTTDIPK